MSENGKKFSLKKSFFKEKDSNFLNFKKNKFSFKQQFKNGYNFIFQNNFRKITFLYIISLLIGTILLLLPISLKTHVNTFDGISHWNFMDALFTAASALTDTGLSVAGMNRQFTAFGSVVILALIQLGGLGFIAFKIFILTLLFRKISYSDKKFVSDEKSWGKCGTSVSVIRTTLFTVFLIEFIGTFAYASHLSTTHFAPEELTLFGNYGKSLWYSLFLTVSSFNNAGFELFGHWVGGAPTDPNHTYTSLFNFINDNTTLFYVMFLIICGGIGFPLFYEIWVNIKNIYYFKWKQIKLSFVLKFTLISYFLILIFGFILLIAFIIPASEGRGSHNMPLAGLSTGRKIANILFLDITSRNAGFSTFDINNLDNPSKIVLTTLMWIGASPFSTGGGIRSTTVFVVFLAILGYISGQREQVKIRSYAFGIPLIINAFVVMIISLILLFGIFIIFSAVVFHLTFQAVNNFNAYDIMIELTSAFGTTGLSSGLTPYLPWYLLLFEIILMIIGQLTISTTLLFWRQNIKSHKNLYESRELEVLIG